MIKYGLVEEVKNLLNLGYSKNLTAFKGLGYKEIIGYLEDKYDLNEAIRILKRNTRRYAKRQLTWFKRYSDILVTIYLIIQIIKPNKSYHQ